MRLRTVYSALSVILATGCATQGDQRAAWTVEPVINVQHAMGDARASYQLGRHHHDQGRLDEAEAAYLQAITLDADAPQALSALGALYAERGELARSVKTFERVVSLAPQLSYLHNNLGYALLLAGQDELAVNALQRAVRLDGSNRRAWRNLADAYRRLGDPYHAAFAEARASGRGSLETQAPPAAAISMPIKTAAPVLLATTDAAVRVTGGTPPPVSALQASGTRLVKLAANVYEVRHEPAAEEPRARQAATTIPATPLASAAPPAASAPRTADAVATAGSSTRRPTNVSRSGPVRYEVSNGQGRDGLARHIATLLHEDGMAFPRLTNQRPFNEPLSVVQYRQGFRDAAEALVARLPFRPSIAESPSTELVSDVRLLLGWDLTYSTACAELELCPQVATRTTETMVADAGPHVGMAD